MCFFVFKKNKKTNLYLQALTHGTVHVIALPKELHDVVLRQNKTTFTFLCCANGELGRATGMLAATYLSVTLPQLGDQFITFVRVQMWRQVGVHAELRAYWSAEAILKTTNRS